ncbi:binding-protein-dependent transport systems inner membrane component [Pseudomonas sp. CFII64]|jgi:peptide/nickel transport system permease protein|uniref:ABC transporter permease n=1 Tax=Pseudomonas sp. CFII64 TaxID=911242 RepID=UPI0003578501|nr:ABC transporter permease [Pseudomonas sp. CFII64]EPJ84843.1 binding-protein-dependent transport systems inner membrane component [Pseudomonas sp. CFII64]
MKTLLTFGGALWRTLLHTLPTMLGILLINFLLLQLAPGDAADVMAGESGSATQESLAALRSQFGLDQTIPVQLWTYLNNLAHFNLGYSPRYGSSVEALISQRLGTTLTLMLLALFFSLVVGIALGMMMANWHGRWPDRVLSVCSQFFYSVPGFWIGLMLIVVFSVKLGWLPTGGAGTIGSDLQGWPALLDSLRYMALPASSLALIYIAIYARLTRASMLEAGAQDYVRTAAAKGLSPWVITFKHVLRNALLPITTMAGLHFGGMLGGAVVIETVFSLPGLGRLAYDAVMARDYNVLLGILLISSLLVIITNILVDLLQAGLDPRIRSRR